MPYVSSVEKYVKQKRTPSHMPGHKQGKGINKTLNRLWGHRFKEFSAEIDELRGKQMVTLSSTQSTQKAAEVTNIAPTDIPSSSPIPTQVVLGASIEKGGSNNSSRGQIAFVFSFLGLGIGFLGLYGFKSFKVYRTNTI
ncbi:MAG TPA: hypothetical protein VGT05_01130 [Patescibacteria group bacterium]|nr:hypothetical protein [Patescibacteria group bacterium]